MKLRQISIRNYKGIQELDFTINEDFICLIGAGDSGKSTLIDAIELVFTNRRSIEFDDSDFFNLDINSPILIIATVIDIPFEFYSESKYGGYLRGWNGTNIIDEPNNQIQTALTIQLKVDKTLEPTWKIINDRNPDGKDIGPYDRGKFNFAKIGFKSDWQFTLSKGSLLTRLISNTEQNLNSYLNELARDTKENFEKNDLSTLKNSFNTLVTETKELAVPIESFEPKLDIKSVNINSSGISLHNNNIPVRNLGLGSKRLLSIVLQKKIFSSNHTILIDEIEHGLEPHRIIRLLKQLKTNSPGQVIISTHSPVPLCELSINELFVINSFGNKVKINKVASDISKASSNLLQKIIRREPSSFLAKIIIVCEGKTEIGILRAFEELAISNGSNPFAYNGVAIMNGNGSESSNIAMKMNSLGYKVALFCDSDVELNPPMQELIEKDIKIFEWSDNYNTEQRIFIDIPNETVKKILEYFIELKGEELIKILFSISFEIEEIQNFINTKFDIEQRLLLAEIVSSKELIKNMSNAISIGNIIFSDYSLLNQETDFLKKLKQILDWIN